jgi:hypothetical protein
VRCVASGNKEALVDELVDQTRFITTTGQQALLVLAYLRKGETFAELAGGFGVGTTAWRYVEEAVALLATRPRSSAGPSGT